MGRWDRAVLAEDIAKAGAVAEVGELGPERRAVRAVLRAGHVGDVGLPPGRIDAAGEATAAPTPDGGRILVAVRARARRDWCSVPAPAGLSDHARIADRVW